MALTRRDKVAIIQTSQAAAGAGVTAGSAAAVGAPLLSSAGLLTVLVPAVALVPPALGLIAHYTRVRFPQLKLEHVTGSLQLANRLRERGLDPLITTDPFTGDLVVATSDQPVEQLLRERAVLRELRATQAEIDELGMLRTQLIEIKADRAVERGFFPSVKSIPRPRGNLAARVRCGFYRETPESPAEYRCFP